MTKASSAVSLFVLLLAGCGGAPPPGDDDDDDACDGGRVVCEGVCVDTASDPRHCSECGTECEEGDVCVDAACQTWDCRESPCPGLSYCELETGHCLPGCAFSDQCGSNEECDLATHECVCADGAHRCSGACLSDASAQSCGDRCEPCPDDPNGAPSCESLQCTLTCDDGYLLCGGACAACPGAGSGDLVCDGDRCVANTCDDGYLLCGGACATCPDASEVACEGAACVARACPEGSTLCATGCCPWTFVTEAALPAARGIALALTAANAPVVSYITSDSTALHVASKSSGSWVDEIVATSVVLAGVSAIAIGDGGLPRVAFVDVSPVEPVLRYAKRGPGSWSVSTPEVGIESSSVSMVVGGDDRAHIVYVSDSTARYAQPETYTYQYVSIGQSAGPSIALDGTGTVHISYQRTLPRELGYAKRTGGSFTASAHDPDVDVAALTSIAAEPDGTPHVLYRTPGGGLHHAVLEGTEWQDELVASGVGSWISVAVDPDTLHVHVAYTDTSHDLIYTHWTGSHWSIQVVAETSGASPIALRLTSTGRPVIAFAVAGVGVRIAR